jgi:hypothetical protein
MRVEREGRQRGQHHLSLRLGLASVVLVALCFLPSLVLAQGTQPGESRAASSGDDVQKNLEEIRKTNAKLSTVIDTAMKQLTDLAKCTDPRQCGAKIDELFTNLQTEVLNVLAKLGRNSELMDAVMKAQTSIKVLKDWYASQPSGYPRREAMTTGLAEQITNLDNAVTRIEDGRVLAQAQLQALMLQQQAIRDQMILEGVRAAVEAVHSVVGELGNLSKALDNVADVKVRPPVRVAQ